MERAVNLLAVHFRQVAVWAAYWCRPSVRFQADKIHSAQVYFDRTDSQITLWQNRGGVLIRWGNKTVLGPHDAMFFAECPRSIEFLDRYSEQTRSVVVVHEPTNWRVHEESVRSRYSDKPRKLRSATDALERIKQLMESTERFTPASLARLLRAHPAASPQPSSALESRAVVARSSGTTAGVP